MGRKSSRVSVSSSFRHYLTYYFRKLLNFVAMRRLLTRLVSRVLLRGPRGPAAAIETQIHTEGRRKLVVGLGNPGMEGTRHSVGMAVLAALAARLGVADRWRGDKQVSGEVIVSEMQRTHVVLLRPRLLMNVNGVSVAKAAGKFGIKPEDILLVHDELDKPLGKVVLKHGGSARGHNGVRSCVDCLQTDVHVLGHFSSSEKKVLESVLVQSVDLLLAQLSQEEPHPPSSPAGGAGKKT
ncbi:putative peptidyl-tRNA hydrolase [Liparis tanakae]|uniref:peptidyl-tRNA hydrolase n=1 Tax=Liparis tanakae TaxID=230148 RepID=A0A4Z2FBJ2_9TELE|nr:putative peptidyl-tRNA hydrolase [Liparis tanakae]